MDKLNYSEHDGNQIDAEGEAFSMECQGSIYEKGIIPHYAIAWHCGSHHVVQHETKCGNCPVCFKAMPLGMHCHCRGQEKCSAILYFCHKANETPQEMLRPADPVLVARTIHAECVLYKDNWHFELTPTPAEHRQTGQCDPTIDNHMRVEIRDYLYHILTIDRAEICYSEHLRGITNALIAQI